jgi:hypothetical protein
MSDQLFELDPVPDPEQLSYTRRLTLRRRQVLDSGFHPATGQRLLAGELTCADCVHCIATGYRSRTYWKCDRVQITSGPGTDIRRGWPACRLFEATDHDPTCQQLEEREKKF